MKTLREMRGMRSQEEVARLVGVSVVTYGNIERRRHVPYDRTIRRIAEVFKVDPTELRNHLVKQEA